MTWFNYRYTSFFNQIENYHDWNDDDQNSISLDDMSITNLQYYDDYFTQAVQEVREIVEDIDDELFDDYTASMLFKLYNYQFTPTEDSFSVNYLTLESEIMTFIETNLITGRMPNNKSELLYYSYNTTHPKFELNDLVTLKSTDAILSQNQTFTVVGVIENIDQEFYQAGYSNDVLTTSFPYIWYGSEYTIYRPDLFITYEQFFIEALRDYTHYEGSLYLNVDFNYKLEISHVRNIGSLMGTLTELQNSYRSSQYIPMYLEYYCFDLLRALDTFQFSWIFDTVLTFTSSIPLVFLYGLVCIETFNIGKHEKTSSFKLFKIHGLEYRTSRRVLVVENLMITSIGLVTGFLLGTLIGYFFFLSMGYSSFIFYINALIEPVIFGSLILMFLLLFLGGFIIENRLAKKTAQKTSDVFKEKRKGFFKRIVTTQEFLTFIPGLVIAAIGFTGAYFVPLAYEVFLSDLVLPLIISLYLLIAIGALLILTSVFLLFSRLINLLWKFVGERIWAKRKNYFTLSLKHLSIYAKDYRLAVLAMFMICLAITPGLILTKSINDHVALEASLATGCSDISVYSSNSFDPIIQSNISEIDGVDSLTTITRYQFTKYPDDWVTNDKGFDISFLVIYNTTKFVEITTERFPEKTTYTLEDINYLQNNMTYLMNTKYAKQNKYHKDEIFTSTMFIRPSRAIYNLTYVNSFDVFPLVPRRTTGIYRQWLISFSLVMSNLTASQLIPKINPDAHGYQQNFLLIKTLPGANKTAISEEISTLNSNFFIRTPEEAKSDYQSYVNDFERTFFTVISILSIMAMCFFGFITAKNIYNQRLRIVESEYQVGAKRYQIWGSFTIEFALIVFIPLIISMVIAILLLQNVFGFLLNIVAEYAKFLPWLPVWLVILIVVFCLFVITIGWIFEMINRVNKYKPIKSE